MCLCVLLMTGNSTAQESQQRDSVGKYSIGIGIGNFDTDTDESDDPHLNEIAYAAILGVELSRYFAIDAEIQKIESGQGFDVFGNLTSFGATSVGTSLRIQYPLDEDFTLYLRGGLARFDIEDDATLRDVALDSSYNQPVFGGGIRGTYWFVEYVNYGEIEDLYIEKLRAGLMFRF